VLPTEPAFQHGFAGLVMLADWLGSDTAFFPYSEEDEHLAATFLDFLGFWRGRGRAGIGPDPRSRDTLPAMVRGPGAGPEGRVGAPDRRVSGGPGRGTGGEIADGGWWAGQRAASRPGYLPHRRDP
jgi:hypothetical protein